MKYIFLFLLLGNFFPFLLAQNNPWHPEDDTLAAKKTSFSDFFHSKEGYAKSFMFSYGYQLNGFRPAMLRFAYERAHWAFIADVYRADLHVTWAEGEAPDTKGYYVLPGFGASGRYYTCKLGRGLYAEFGAMTTSPSLKITYQNIEHQDSVRRDRWKTQYMSWGAGYRIGKKPRGFFAEIGYRGSMPLHSVFLYTEREPTIFRHTEVLYHAWLMRRFRVITQGYVGIGYSF